MDTATLTVQAAQRHIHHRAAEVNPEFVPSYHAVAPIGWINDPNGFVFFRGQYHLFGQYHPYSSQWGPMHWGHWVSDNLVQWRWSGVALAPDTPADRGGCFSGTAYVYNNRLYLMYTGLTDDGEGGYYQMQCIAYSDDGQHFFKHAGNPVIGMAQMPQGASVRDFRDPKLLRTKDGEWRAIIANRGPSGGRLLLFRSSDLSTWRYDGVFLGRFEQMLECPDYFWLDDVPMIILSVIDLPPDGRRYPHGQPSLLLRGKTDPEQRRFEELDRQALDHGWDYYAPQSLLALDGRRLVAGWLQCWAHRMPSDYLNHGWNGCMALVRELHTKNGKLLQRPVRELEALRCRQQCHKKTLYEGDDLVAEISAAADVLVTLQSIHAAQVELRLFESENESLHIVYRQAGSLLSVDTSACGYTVCSDPKGSQQCLSQTEVALPNGQLSMRCLVDTCSVEIFINDGEQVVSTRVFPKHHGRGLRLCVPEGSCIATVVCHTLNV